jgi:hypothetical protein
VVYLPLAAYRGGEGATLPDEAARSIGS